MSGNRTPRLADLAHGLQRSLRRPPAPKAPPRVGPHLPTKTPQDNLELLSVLDPTRFRALCQVMHYVVEEIWYARPTGERRKAIEEVDRRRGAVKDRPGSWLL